MPYRGVIFRGFPVAAIPIAGRELEGDALSSPDPSGNVRAASRKRRLPERRDSSYSNRVATTSSGRSTLSRHMKPRFKRITMRPSSSWNGVGS